MPSLEQLQKQTTDFLSGLTATQRIVLGFATVLTVAVLAAFAHFISTPDYVPLMTGMEPADAQALGAKLAAKNISYQIAADGKGVNVPSDKLDSSRMEIAADGMPHSGRMGFELFDKLNWGQTEFDEKVNYQRALEGELERSIQTLRDVDSVRVHLVMSTDSVFVDRERAAKASVILRLRSGRLSEDAQIGIARLVSGAVDKLSPENVTVIDADTNRSLGKPKHGDVTADASVEQEYTGRLLQTVEPVVGAQRVRASVNVEYDPSSSEENQETYDPKSAVVVASQMSQEQIGGGLASGGVPGTSSNVPAENGAKPAVVKPSEDDGEGTQISKSESNTYAVNKVVRHIVEPAGRIRRISAALLVDDATDVKQENGKRSEVRRKRTPEELKQIETLAKAAIGIDVARGDTLTVQNLSFDQAAPVDAPGKPGLAERVRVTLNDWSSLVRYGALLLLFLLVYLLLLKPLKNQILATFKELPARAAAQKSQAETLPGQEMAALPPEQRAAALKRQLADTVRSEPAAATKLIQAWLNEGAR